MPKKATGQIRETVTKDGDTTFAVRLRVNGKRPLVTLGTKSEGWTLKKAETERDNLMADVRRGTFRLPEPEPEPKGDQTFHEFADDWFETNRHEWSERTVDDYRATLELHVLPYFADYLLGDITIEVVDKFKAAKLKEGRLAPAQINKCIKRVSQILELAAEYELIDRNPAGGKRRKVKEPSVKRSWVEPEQAMALIEGSSIYMRPVVATLIGTGLRVGELTALEWPDVVLATGTIKVGKAKTDAGTFRELDLPAELIDELKAWRQRSLPILEQWQKENRSKAQPVFLTKVKGGRYTGQLLRQTEANIARRLKTSIKRANERLAAKGIEPISDRVTPHSLRRTFASLRAALKDDIVYVSEQMGHKDVRFTLNVYSKAVKRRAKLHGAHLAEFDRALAWATLTTTDRAQTGTTAPVADQLAQELSKDLAS